MPPSRSPRSFHVLLSSSYAVLTIGSNLSALVFLSECIADSQLVTSATRPNYLETFFLATIPPEELPNWSWNKSARVFVETPPTVLTDELRALSKLATSKLNVIVKMTNHINNARLKVRTGLDFQQTIYIEKKMEAQRFKDSGYNESTIIEYPYILQYADFKNISPREAADAILLKAKLTTNLLAKTEIVRLRYFNKVKAATEEELPEIYDRFMRETYVNPKIRSKEQL